MSIMNSTDSPACDEAHELFEGVHNETCRPRTPRTEQEKREGRARLAEARKQILADNRAYNQLNKSGKQEIQGGK